MTTLTKPEPTAEEVCRALVTLWPTWRQAQDLKRSCCILATRLSIEVLRYWNIKAEPMPVAVHAHNPQLAAIAATGVTLSVEQMEQIGGWSVGTDPDIPPTMPREWNCHLGAYVPAVGGLLDLSLEQYDRPSKGIVLGSALVRLVDDFAESGQWHGLTNSRGCRVIYKHRPDQVGYRDAPDWTGDRTKYAANLIRTVRRFIEHEHAPEGEAHVHVD